MRILTISNCNLVRSQGSGYVIINFSCGLRNLGHEVDLFGPDNYKPLKFLNGRANQYRIALGMFFFTLKQLKKKRYDILEFYGAEAWLIVSYLRILRDCPYLITSHSNGLETRAYEERRKYESSLKITRKWYQLNQNSLFSKYFRDVDGIVTVSQCERNYALDKAYQNSEKIVSIENSLPNNYLNISVDFNRQPVIAYCGSWLLNKGIHLIKSDLPRVLRKFPDSKLKLIGVGSNFKKEEHFPVDICHRIEVIDFVENKNLLRTIYQSISILIMPSICESFGLVSSEAMACGCALVANKTGFADSLKHREEAMLLDEPLSPRLSELLEELLIDEPLRLKIAKAGYQRIQNLRWDLAINKLEVTYTSWLEEFNGYNDIGYKKRHHCP